MIKTICKKHRKEICEECDAPKLKTLNDFDPEACCHGINKRELKVEAIKWHKELCDKSEQPSVCKWIERFFNLTEEDLK